MPLPPPASLTFVEVRTCQAAGVTVRMVTGDNSVERLLGSVETTLTPSSALPFKLLASAIFLLMVESHSRAQSFAR